MFTIAKRFSFSASHQLTHLPDSHPCSRLHGHNYEVEFILRADIQDRDGFVYDYRKLDAVKAWIDNTLDHRHLNTIYSDARGTTAEGLALALYTTWRPHLGAVLHAVRVSETPKTWAEFTPSMLDIVSAAMDEQRGAR